ALARLIGGPFRSLDSLRDLAQQFEQPEKMTELVERMRSDRRPWRGELRLARGSAGPTPVALRADPIPQMHGGIFGFILVLNDLTARDAADHARARLQRAIYAAQRP